MTKKFHYKKIKVQKHHQIKSSKAIENTCTLILVSIYSTHGLRRGIDVDCWS